MATQTGQTGHRTGGAATRRRAPDRGRRWADRLRPAAERFRPRSGPTRWCWGTWLVVSASVAWLALVLLHRGLSGRVWWWSLPELLPPLALLVVPMLLGAVAPLARPARGRIALLLTAALLLGWGGNGVNLATVWHHPPPPPAEAITVFAWNTWYWDQSAAAREFAPPPGGTPPQQRERFFAFLREQQADVYLLQEHLYFTEDGAPIRVDDSQRLAEEFPDHHLAVAGELLTLSRYPIVHQRGLDLRAHLSWQLTDLPPPDSELPIYHVVKTLRTDLLIGGQTVSFYNSHLHVPGIEATVHRGETREHNRWRHELRRADFTAIATDLAQNPHPVVLAGDLNTSPAMGMTRLLPNRLIDATPALSSLYPVSWDEQWLRLWRLDWVFTTAEVTVHRYRLVDSGELSDHSGQHLIVSVDP